MLQNMVVMNSRTPELDKAPPRERTVEDWFGFICLVSVEEGDEVIINQSTYICTALDHNQRKLGAYSHQESSLV